MNRCKLVLCLAVFAAACLPAHAQQGVRVNIPFDFTAGHKFLPAGEYVVIPATTRNNAFWMIKNLQNGEGNILNTNSEVSPIKQHQVSLLFHRNGGQYSLMEFWMDENNGRSVVGSKAIDTRIAQADIVEIAAGSR